MKFIQTKDKKFEEIVTKLLNQGEWLIACDASDPKDIFTYTLQNVLRIDKVGYFAKEVFGMPVLISYGISPAIEGEHPFRIHDYEMIPISSTSSTKERFAFNKLEALIQVWKKNYDVMVVDTGEVDRSKVYGKILTDHSDEIVFWNK
mgnify:FL=1